MTFNRFSRCVILGCGLAGGLLASLLGANSPQLRQGEVIAHDAVMALRRPGSTPQDIVLMTLRFAPPSDPDQLDPNQYVTLPEEWLRDQFNPILESLVPALVERAQARVVMLTAPEQWPQPQDAQFSTIETIASYQKQLVLVNRVAAQPRHQSASINTVVPVLPFDHKTRELTLRPQQIQGFWPDQSLDDWRTTPLTRKFSVPSQSDQGDQIFASMALLAYQKWRGSSVEALGNGPQQWSKPVWVPFLGQGGTFVNLDVTISGDCTQACYERALQGPLEAAGLADLSGKIVLVEPVSTPSGDIQRAGQQTPVGLMSMPEIQATVLASLIQGSVVQEVSRHQVLITRGLIGGIALLISGGILWGIERRGRSFVGVLGVSALAVGIGYGLLYGWAGVWFGMLLPLLEPLLAWTGTTLATLFCALHWQRELLLTAQAQELERLRGETEENALVLKTKTLLHRIACDVHGGPLQELKVAMFQVEQLQRQDPQLPVAPILETLGEVGKNVRGQLNNVQAIATKLRITPQLRDGLAVGIGAHLDRMLAVGRLQLEVVKALQPLPEPELNTLWVAAREDIFRFFCEAMNNVVCHAQPPQGGATQVRVSLGEQEGVGWVAIANNNPTPPLNTTDPQSWGQGTKEMALIAHDLPGGQWSRTPLATGGLEVKLSWQMTFNPEDLDPQTAEH